MRPILWAAAFAMAFGPLPASFAQGAAQTQTTAQAEQTVNPKLQVKTYRAKSHRRPVISIVTRADSEKHQRMRAKSKITMSRD